jgi:hypothetical protein
MSWNLGLISFRMSQGSPKESIYVSIEGKHIRGLTKVCLLAPRIYKLDPPCIKLERHVNLYVVGIISPKTKVSSKLCIRYLKPLPLSHPMKLTCISMLLNK